MQIAMQKHNSNNNNRTIANENGNAQTQLKQQ